MFAPVVFRLLAKLFLFGYGEFHPLGNANLSVEEEIN